MFPNLVSFLFFFTCMRLILFFMNCFSCCWFLSLLFHIFFCFMVKVYNCHVSWLLLGFSWFCLCCFCVQLWRVSVFLWVLIGKTWVDFVFLGVYLRVMVVFTLVLWSFMMWLEYLSLVIWDFFGLNAFLKVTTEESKAFSRIVIWDIQVNITEKNSSVI